MSLSLGPRYDADERLLGVVEEPGGTNDAATVANWEAAVGAHAAHAAHAEQAMPAPRRSFWVATLLGLTVPFRVAFEDTVYR